MIVGHAPTQSAPLPAAGVFLPGGAVQYCYGFDSAGATPAGADESSLLASSAVEYADDNSLWEAVAGQVVVQSLCKIPTFEYFKEQQRLRREREQAEAEQQLAAAMASWRRVPVRGRRRRRMDETEEETGEDEAVAAVGGGCCSEEAEEDGAEEDDGARAAAPPLRTSTPPVRNTGIAKGGGVCLTCGTTHTSQWRLVSFRRHCNACYAKLRRWLQKQRKTMQDPVSVDEGWIALGFDCHFITAEAQAPSQPPPTDRPAQFFSPAEVEIAAEPSQHPFTELAMPGELALPAELPLPAELTLPAELAETQGVGATQLSHAVAAQFPGAETQEDLAAQLPLAAGEGGYYDDSQQCAAAAAGLEDGIRMR